MEWHCNGTARKRRMNEGMHHYRRILLWLVLVAPAALRCRTHRQRFAASQRRRTASFCAVDQAFVMTADLADDGSLHVQWQMPDGYYLYRHRFEFAVPDGSPICARRTGDSAGQNEDRRVLRRGSGLLPPKLSARVPVTRTARRRHARSHDRLSRLRRRADCVIRRKPDTCRFPPTRLRRAARRPRQRQLRAATARGARSAKKPKNNIWRQCSRTAILWLSLAMFFALGLGLAFTPCVLPMVPILSSIIVGQGGSVTRTRAFTLSLAYVLGMAVTYAALGMLVGSVRRAHEPAGGAAIGAGVDRRSQSSSCCSRCRCSVSTSCSCRPRGRTASMRCRRTSAAAHTSAS